MMTIAARQIQKALGCSDAAATNHAKFFAKIRNAGQQYSLKEFIEIIKGNLAEEE